MNLTRIAAIAVATLFVVLVGCSDGPSDGRFDEGDCPMEIPAGQDGNVRCGTITLPADTEDEDASEVTLAVAVLESTAEEPSADPILIVQGGPGMPTLAGALQAFTSDFAAPLQSSRDLVFVDQRGTGFSTPSLDCPEQRESYRASLSDAADLYDGLALCGERLAEEGIDLSHYHSAAIARDLSAVMRALEYEEWNVYGWSYGSRIALTMLRDDPSGIRSVVVDAVAPPQVDIQSGVSATFGGALEKLAADCAADASCGAAYPGFEVETLFRAREVLDATPQTVGIDDPLGGTVQVIIDGLRFREAVLSAMYDVRLIPSIPGIVTAVADGDVAAAKPLVAATLFDFDSTADGMFFAVNCNEEFPFDTGATSGLQLCEDLGMTLSPDPIEEQAVSSDVSTLLLSGAYDPVIPPDNAEAALETLSAGALVPFVYEGHGALLTLQAMEGETPDSRGCVVSLIAAFLDEPGSAPDGSCVAGLSSPAFVVE